MLQSQRSWCLMSDSLQGFLEGDMAMSPFSVDLSGTVPKEPVSQCVRRMQDMNVHCFYGMKELGTSPALSEHGTKELQS